jgi:hypothetical protein
MFALRSCVLSVYWSYGVDETALLARANDNNQAIRFALIRRPLIVVRFISNEGDAGIFAARPDAYPVEADRERTRGNLYRDGCLGLSRGDGSIDNRDSRRSIDQLNLNIASRKVDAFTLDCYGDVTAGKRYACRIRCKRPTED